MQIYFFCVKRQAKIDFLKDVESTVGINVLRYSMSTYWERVEYIDLRRRSWSDCVITQVDLALCSSHMSLGMFSYVAIEVFDMNAVLLISMPVSSCQGLKNTLDCYSLDKVSNIRCDTVGLKYRTYPKYCKKEAWWKSKDSDQNIKTRYSIQVLTVGYSSTHQKVVN